MMIDETAATESESTPAPAAGDSEPSTGPVTTPDAVETPEAAPPTSSPATSAGADEPRSASDAPAHGEIIEDVVEAPAPTPAAPEPPKKHWYVLKVQSGREDSIRNALERRVKIDSLEEYVGRILVPTEKVVEMVRGKRVTKKRKKFPGYIMVEVEFNDKILFLFRETSGVGDFVGGSLNRVPNPMEPRDVERMLADEDDVVDGKKGGEGAKQPTVVVKVQKGDRVRVQSGTFAGMEGEVKEVMHSADPKEAPRVKVEVVIWGRPVSMDIEYFYVDLVE